MPIIKRFAIQKLGPRELTETHHRPVKHDGMKTTGFVPEQVTRTVEESYMVHFPAGHSVWFETKEAMAHAGILEDANTEIDSETGLPVERAGVVDFERINAARRAINTHHHAKRAV